MTYEVAITGLQTREDAELLEAQMALLKTIMPEGMAVVVRETHEQQHFPSSEVWCIHPAYSDGHCADMTCMNYVNRCPRHSPAGRDNVPCSHGKEHGHQPQSEKG